MSKEHFRLNFYPVGSGNGNGYGSGYGYGSGSGYGCGCYGFMRPHARRRP